MAWQVKNWRKNTGQGKVKGWFKLVAGDLEINDISLVEGSKGDFVSFPQRKYQDKEGNTKYVSIVWIPDEKRRWEFNDWAVKELDNLRRVEPATEEEDEQIPF